jgi:hypothetical protein
MRHTATIVMLMLRGQSPVSCDVVQYRQLNLLSVPGE